MRVYAEADWYFWPTAERIAARDEVSTAAAAIGQVITPILPVERNQSS